MGVKVKIMLPYDPTGKKGINKPMPDNVIINDPKLDVESDQEETQ
jgi:small subunit ribosomal protein S3e